VPSTHDRFFAQSYGIGLRRADGKVDATSDARTMYHAERVLQRFRPSIMAITLLDVDTCHVDFNGYLRGQQIAGAAVAHLWDVVQADAELRDTTTMIVMPEHGRHLFMNGNNLDSLGRSGIDHGQGDSGDRDVWMLALGPDKRNNVIAPTGITQTGRGSGRDGDLGGGVAEVSDCRSDGVTIAAAIPQIAADTGRHITGTLEFDVNDIGELAPGALPPGVRRPRRSTARREHDRVCVTLVDAAGHRGQGDCTQPVAVVPPG